MTAPLHGLRVGYAPYTDRLDQPGDRRRFGFYARRRDVAFDLADPGGDYDVVVVSGRADLSRWSRYRGRGKVVFDLVNAYLLEPPGTRNLLRGAAKFVTREFRRPALDYRRTVEAMCRRADAVVCAVEEVRDAVRPLCANVHVVLDSFHDVAGPVKETYEARGDAIQLVWEGLPENLAGFAELRGVLEEFAAARPLELHLVTSLRHARYMARFSSRPTADVVARILGTDLARSTRVHQWDARVLGRVATACDLGVIPLRLGDPFSAGKPANKLLGLWWMAVPTLASATPAYRRAAEAAGVPHTVCADESGWLDALRRYATDADARREAGTRGHAYVTGHCSEEHILERWDAVFASVLDPAPGGATP